MLTYVARRVLIMFMTLLAVSALVFVIIQLPPGDYLTTYIAELESQGELVDPQKIEFLRQEYGLDKPMIEQYWIWISGLVQGDLGYSFEYELPVNEVVGDRLLLSFVLNFSSG
jgi:peptide/nickel transport system permease protein